MRISDWSSDVCSSDLAVGLVVELREIYSGRRESFGSQCQRSVKCFGLVLGTHLAGPFRRIGKKIATQIEDLRAGDAGITRAVRREARTIICDKSIKAEDRKSTRLNSSH